LHANIGIEIRDTAEAVIRSNLMLVDKSRNGIGVLYTGDVPYNFATASKTVTISKQRGMECDKSGRQVCEL
jgi:hypothetical protein